MTQNKKKSLTLFVFLFVFLIFGLLVSKNVLEASSADPIKYKSQVDIPGSGLNGEKIMTESDTSYIAMYIKALYNYGLSIVGILATIVLMGGGILWLISGGDSGKITQAKELITGSIAGLIILVTAWVVLNTVNPALVSFKVSSIPTIEKVMLDSISCETTTASSTCSHIAFCVWKDNKCVGKIEGGAAKCSTDKKTVPGPQVCCCQTANNGSYTTCKWATFMGTAYVDGPSGAPKAGPCAACGGIQYAQVRSGGEYLCDKAYTLEQEAKNNTSTAFTLTGCENKAEKSSCTKIIDLPNGSKSTVEGFCLSGSCNDCFAPGKACDSAWFDNFKCATVAGGKCGSEAHGNCQLKIGKDNICEAISN